MWPGVPKPEPGTARMRSSTSACTKLTSSAMGVLGKYVDPEDETVLSLILEALGRAERTEVPDAGRPEGDAEPPDHLEPGYGRGRGEGEDREPDDRRPAAQDEERGGDGRDPGDEDRRTATARELGRADVAGGGTVDDGHGDADDRWFRAPASPAQPCDDRPRGFVHCHACIAPEPSRPRSA